MIQPTSYAVAAASLLALTTPCLQLSAWGQASPPAERRSPDGVRPLFDIGHPHTAPFPSDVFTVRDASHNTGRRVSLPYPDCVAQRSDCDDLDVINTLDGFGLQ
ncbi:MAG: hypothetical protein AB7N65_21055, partial [Vicinamibacterales bacterium]